MGVHLSTMSTLAPISMASSIIGFISFAVTVATFLRVFWQNLQTLWSADHEVPDILTTLRQELYEERNSLKALRRHLRARGGQHSRDVFAGPELDATVIRTLERSIRDLTRRFKNVERPFLAPRERERRGQQSRRRRNSRRDSFDHEDAVEYYTGLGSREEWEDEKGGANAKGRQRDWMDEEDYSRDVYCNMTLGKRIAWLRLRGDAMALLSAVSRVQTRRIARQVGEIAVVLHEYGDVVLEMRHGISSIENRLNRVVGLRRVD